MERDRQKQQQKQQMQRISQNQSDNDAPHQPLFGVPFKVRKQQIIPIFPNDLLSSAQRIHFFAVI